MGQRARRAVRDRGPAVAAIRIVAVGRAPPGPERDLFERYASRLRPKPVLVELADGVGAEAEIRRREADAILAALAPRMLVVALDQNGKATDSLAFASCLQRWTDTGRALAFVLGGAEGLERRVLERADHLLSLGPATWPHLLARAMLAEQLYRAQAIRLGHPYHREGSEFAAPPRSRSNRGQGDDRPLAGEGRSPSKA